MDSVIVCDLRKSNKRNESIEKQLQFEFIRDVRREIYYI